MSSVVSAWIDGPGSVWGRNPLAAGGVACTSYDPAGMLTA